MIRTRSIAIVITAVILLVMYLLLGCQVPLK
jgi:hypothetical protein